MTTRALPLLLAAAATAAGCYSHGDHAYGDQPGTITFYWRFQDAQNAVAGDYTAGNAGCDVAGVDTIAVTIDGETDYVGCTDPQTGIPGVQLTNFAAGQYDYVVDGYRGGAPNQGGERVFTQSGTAYADWGVDSPTDTTLRPVNPQSLVIYYNVNGFTPTQCAVNGTAVAGVSFELDDAQGNVVFATTQPVPCDRNTFGVAVASLPLGAYSLRYMALVDATGAALVQTCRTGLAHGGFPAIVNLTAATQACP